MRKILKIFGVVLLALINVAFLVGLAIMTIWLFRQGKGNDWGFWLWFSVLFEVSVLWYLRPLEYFGLSMQQRKKYEIFKTIIKCNSNGKVWCKDLQRFSDRFDD